MFVLRCPKCKNQMKYLPSKHSTTISGKIKKCVYCNRSFKVTENIVKQEKQSAEQSIPPAPKW